MIHLGDITRLHGGEIPVVDIITGGSPCQDLSVAGKRAGLGGERSGLFMEQIRIVKEMRERDRRTGRSGWAVRPRFMVWENVPGAFSSNKGRDFQAVLSEIVKIAEPDAPDVPLPDKGKWPHSGCLYSDMGDWSVAWRLHDAQFWGVPQRRKRIALVADFGGLAAPEILFEREGLSGDPEPRGEAREGASSATGGGVEGAISFQERAGKPGGGKGLLIQPERTGALSTLNNQSVLATVYGISPTLTARMGTGGNQVNALCMDVGFFQTEEEKTGALLARQYKDPPIVVKEGTEAVGTLCAESYPSKLAHQDVVSGLYPVTPTAAQTVRRLTPLECERLQGFPDGWTDIGEWVDSNGKKHKEADSPRYKALGNSIALPFWQWMARRICAQYERTPTMGSLFDGIGGFPLVFQRSGAVPVWASEIEEFPIAVTKYHFKEE